MKNQEQKEKNKKINLTNLFPKVLKHYTHFDFATKLRASIVFYLCLVAIFLLLLIIASSFFIQLTSPNHPSIHFPEIIAELVVLIVFACCIVLLIKGFLNISIHTILVSAFISIWFIMWSDKGPALIRLDSIAYVLGLLSLTILFVDKKKILIIFYTLANIIMLYFFSRYVEKELNITDNSINDYIIDSSLSLVFIGIVGFFISIISKKSLEQALSDINKREKAEENLKYNEEGYRLMFEQNPQPMIIYDIKSYDILEVNESAAKLYGFRKDEFVQKTIFDIQPKEDLPSFNQRVSKLTESSVLNLETRHIIKSGEIIYIEITGHNIYYNKRDSRHILIKDVTVRKKAEYDLAKSEKKFREMADLLPQIIFETDLNGNLTYINQNAYKLLGYNEEDFKKGINILSVVSDEDREKAMENFKLAIGGQPKKQFQYTAVKKDGTLFPMEGFTSIIEENGTRIGLRGIVVDITERLKTENSIKQTSQKYMNALESLPLGCFLMHEKGQIYYTNKKFTEFFGYTLDEVPNIETWYNLAFPDQDYRNKVIQGWERANQMVLSGAFIRNPQIYKVKTKSGVDKTIGFQLSMFEGEWLVLLNDISIQKKAEEALKQSKELFKSIIEFAPEAIVVNDFNSKYLILNNAFTKQTGFSPEDLLGKTFEKINLFPNPLAEKYIKNQLKYRKQVQNYETTLFDKNGNILDIIYSGKIIHLENKSVVISSIINITEKKKTDRELEKYRNKLELLVKERTDELEVINEELLQTNEELISQREELESALENLQQAQKQLIHSEKMASLGVLAAGVAHEINNPLNFISGSIAILENYFADNLIDHLNKVAPLIHSIQTGVNRAAAIVYSLNTYSHRDDSMIVKCDIQSIIENCLLILNNEIKHKIEVDKYFVNPPFIIEGNEGKLHQAMLNILVNAVQSIENKGRISISIEKEENRLRISFSDTGCGIEPENIGKILDPFFTTKAPGKGTGLGLSITYNIIHEHNGTIEFDSKIGKGTVVTVFF